MPDGKKHHHTKDREHKSHHKRYHSEDTHRSDEENYNLKRQHRNRHDSPDSRDKRYREERGRRENVRHWAPDRGIKREPEDFGDRRERREHGRRREQNRRRQPNNPFNNSDDKYEWGKKEIKSEDKKIDPKDKDKPNFGLSGKLAEDTNVFNGVVIKYNEPPEARKPKKRWRLYPFKGDQELPFVPIHRQSAYLLGRSRAIVDIPTDHPSCSKQHAVIQFRMIDYEREDGSIGKRVRPYMIDLESANGTFVNNKKIEQRCYVELLEKDVLKFGFSTREYVVLHEGSKDDALDDNVDE